MRYEHMPIISPEEAHSALAVCTDQILRCLPAFTNQFPNAYSENGLYQPTDNVGWTTGFWTGEIWLAYEFTGDERLRRAAETQIESFYRRICEQTDVDHHDMGFLYSPSCVAGYRLTGSPRGKEAALMAARRLAARFHEKGAFIQAWGRAGLGAGLSSDYRLHDECAAFVLGGAGNGRQGIERRRGQARCHNA